MEEEGWKLLDEAEIQIHPITKYICTFLQILKLIHKYKRNQSQISMHDSKLIWVTVDAPMVSGACRRWMIQFPDNSTVFTVEDLKETLTWSEDETGECSLSDTPPERMRLYTGARPLELPAGAGMVHGLRILLLVDREGDGEKEGEGELSSDTEGLVVPEEGGRGCCRIL
jgi:hypothetical protein